jgi:hypothetical protein
MQPSFESSVQERDPDVTKFVALFETWAAADEAFTAVVIGSGNSENNDPDKNKEVRDTYRRALDGCTAFIKARAKTKGAMTFNGELYGAIPSESRDLVNNLRGQVMDEILEEMRGK